LCYNEDSFNFIISFLLDIQAVYPTALLLCSAGATGFQLDIPGHPDEYHSNGRDHPAGSGQGRGTHLSVHAHPSMAVYNSAACCGTPNANAYDPQKPQLCNPIQSEALSSQQLA